MGGIQRIVCCSLFQEISLALSLSLTRQNLAANINFDYFAQHIYIYIYINTVLNEIYSKNKHVRLIMAQSSQGLKVLASMHHDLKIDLNIQRNCAHLNSLGKKVRLASVYRFVARYRLLPLTLPGLFWAAKRVLVHLYEKFVKQFYGILSLV
jgi:hypothetical protein